MVIKIKTIGIIIREFKENNIEFIGTRYDLFNSLYQFNVNLIGIPINIDYNKLIESVNLCDGIILSGGENFHENDFKLIKYLVEKNIPTLGICLGMQSMAEYFNNRREIVVTNHYSTNKYVHKIKIKRGSKLYKILNKDEILVNSRHHTGIPYTNMLISAKSEDNIIEAVELSNLKFFIGLEWHPESINDNNSYLIFKSFINKL
jgi:putative glutamine amidotransferase